MNPVLASSFHECIFGHVPLVQGQYFWPACIARYCMSCERLRTLATLEGGLGVIMEQNREHGGNLDAQIQVPWSGDKSSW